MRIPFADTSLYKAHEQLSDEQVLFLADIMPTAYEVGALNGNVTSGNTVAIVGAGPIGEGRWQERQAGQVQRDREPAGSDGVER